MKPGKEEGRGERPENPKILFSGLAPLLYLLLLLSFIP